MKKSLFLFCLSVFTLCCLSVKSKNRVINHPSCLYSASELFLKKIALTDTATILSFRVDCAFSDWTLTSSVSLQANGKSYAYRSGKLFTQKEGQVMEVPFSTDSINKAVYALVGDRYVAEKDSLVLYFDPLPTDVSTFDFLEGTSDRSWKIYGIRMDGAPYPLAFSKPEKMPDIPLSPYVPKAGKAVLKGHICGYNHSAMKYAFGYGGNDYSLTANPFDFTYSMDSLGYFRFEGDITHPIPFNFILLGCRQNVVLVPGEVNELLFDVATYSSTDPRLSRSHALWFGGNYGAVNEVLNNCNDATFRYARFIDFLKNALTLSFDEYVQDIWSKYQNALSEIAADKKLNTQQRDFLKLKAQAYYLTNRTSYLQHVEDGLYYSDIKKDSTSFGKYQTQFSLKDPHAQELTLFNDLNALYVIYDCSLIDYLKANNLTDSKVYQWMQGLKKAQEMASQINTLHPVTDDSTWNGIAPQYVPALKQLNDTIVEKIKQTNASAAGVIRDVPDVPAEQLVQTIVNQYKGKVVLIDCWATWCGPCRTGITKMEPLKEELLGKGVVFVYLTNESSNATTWMKDVEKMKGEHYMISNEKWDKLPNIKAIPHYLLFNKEGKQILDQVGWNDGLVDKFKEYLYSQPLFQ